MVSTATKQSTLIQQPNTQASDNPFRSVETSEAAKKISQTDVLKVTIASPKSEKFFTQDESIKIAGATKKGSVVAILGGKNPVLLGANEDGSFAPTIELHEGVNELSINVFGINGQVKKESRTVIMLKDTFAEEELDLIISPTASNSKEEKDKIILNNSDGTTTSLTTTKQTKWYTFAQGSKKPLKNQKLSNLPSFAITSKTDPVALAIAQYETIDSNLTIFNGEVRDKNISLEEGLNIQVVNQDNSNQLENNFMIGNDSVITANGYEESLKPTDIKIGDKVVIVYEKPEEASAQLQENAGSKENNTLQAQYVHISPGKGSSILKDLKNPQSPE